MMEQKGKKEYLYEIVDNYFKKNISDYKILAIFSGNYDTISRVFDRSSVNIVVYYEHNKKNKEIRLTKGMIEYEYGNRIESQIYDSYNHFYFYEEPLGYVIENKNGKEYTLLYLCPNNSTNQSAIIYTSEFVRFDDISLFKINHTKANLDLIEDL